MAEERVLRLRVVGGGPRGAAVIRERILVAIPRPLQDVGADEQQVGPVPAQFQGPVDRGQRLVLPLLSEQGNPQVGVAERFLRQQLDQAAIGGFGLGRPLVLELGVAEVPQAHRLLRGRGDRQAGGAEDGDGEEGWKFPRHGRWRAVVCTAPQSYASRLHTARTAS